MTPDITNPPDPGPTILDAHERALGILWALTEAHVPVLAVTARRHQRHDTAVSIRIGEGYFEDTPSAVVRAALLVVFGKEWREARVGKIGEYDREASRVDLAVVWSVRPVQQPAVTILAGELLGGGE